MSKEQETTLVGGKSVKYDILKVLVYDKHGKRKKEEDFKLEFIKTKAGTKDITKRFTRYMKQEYNRYFNEYYIPTVISNTFITSTTISPYKEFPPNSIIAFKRPEKNTTPVSFKFGDYVYTKEGNEFNVKYVGNKNEITTFPFGGLSEYKINFYECYKDTKITKFDFDNLMMDMCTSTERMFYKCRDLTTVVNFSPHLYKIPLKCMVEMFAYCYSLKDIDLSELNQSFSIYQIQRMFYACLSLKKIDITGLKLNGKYGNDSEESSMFRHCYNLSELNCTKDQIIAIKRSLPNHELWIDERIYKKYKNKNEGNNSVSASKKTRKLKYINTLYQSMLLINDLDKETNNLMLVKNLTK